MLLREAEWLGPSLDARGCGRALVDILSGSQLAVARSGARRRSGNGRIGPNSGRFTGQRVLACIARGMRLGLHDEAAGVSGSAVQRREVRYRGSVQGVGFRYTAVRLARGFDVSGFVRNEPDRSVRLVVEGLPAEIDGFLRELADLMRENIEQATAQTGTPTGEFAGFVIRH